MVILLFAVYAICDYNYYAGTLGSSPFVYCKRVSRQLYQWFVILGVAAYVLIIYFMLIFYGIKRHSKKVMYLSFAYVLCMVAIMISFGSICIFKVDRNYSESFYCGPFGNAGGYLLIGSGFILGVFAIAISYFTINLFIDHHQRQHALLNDEYIEDQ